LEEFEKSKDRLIAGKKGVNARRPLDRKKEFRGTRGKGPPGSKGADDSGEKPATGKGEKIRQKGRSPKVLIRAVNGGGKKTRARLFRNRRTQPGGKNERKKGS